MTTTTDEKLTGFPTASTPGKTTAPSVPTPGAGPSTSSAKTPASSAPAPGAGPRKGALSAQTKDEAAQVAKAQELLAKRQDELREKQELVVLRLAAKDILGKSFEKKTRRFVLDALVEHYDRS